MVHYPLYTHKLSLVGVCVKRIGKNRRSLALFAAVAAFSFAGAQGAAAHEIKPAVTKLLNQPLAGIDGTEANVVLVAVGPGWTSGKPTIPSHIFLYSLQSPT